LLKKTSVPVMLVSDIAEAQEIAVSFGGVRGFGKAQLGEPSTLELVLRVASAKVRPFNQQHKSPKCPSDFLLQLAYASCLPSSLGRL
jgi:hypothetical protein